MAERTVKNSFDSLAAGQPRLLKTRRSERPDEETKTVDIQAHLQESTVTSAVEQQQMEHQSLVIEQEPRNREATDLSADTETATAKEVGPPTTFKNSSVDPQPEGLMAPMNNQYGDLEEVVVVAETTGSEPRPCIDPLQIIPGSTTGAFQEKPVTSFKDQPSGKKSSKCDIEKNRETNQHDSISDSTADVKEVTMENQVFLPAKKKPRMEMCILAVEEHFIQAETEMSLLPGPSSEFTQTGREAEQAEAQLQLNVSDRNDRIQAEVHGAVIISDGLNAVVNPAQEGQSCEDKYKVVDGSQECGNTRSDPPAGQDDQEQQPLDGDPVDNVSEQSPQQMKGLEEVDQSATPGLNPISLKNQAAKNSDVTLATPLLANNDTNAAGENTNYSASDAAEGSSSTETSSGGCAVRPAVPSLGSEKKHTLDVDDGHDTCPSYPGTEPCLNKGSTDPFGSFYLDYVSDSQLSTIPLIEEEIVKGEKDLGSSDCPDGTDLICGLIKELSWLNWKVMATHRELESLRRSSKILRSSTR